MRFCFCLDNKYFFEAMVIGYFTLVASDMHIRVAAMVCEKVSTISPARSAQRVTDNKGYSDF